jgi:thiopurine S-methyltransferase
MQPDFWRARWAEGRTNFHQEAVHEQLVRHAERFLGGGPRRVLVPLCGKSVDLAWIRDRGHEVVGVELVPEAIAAIFERETSTAHINAAGSFRRWTGAGMTILEGDIFGLHPDVSGTFDRIWDRAATVALAPEQRPLYAQLLRSVLVPGGRVLMETFLYEQAQKPGPPHAVLEDELIAAWGNAERIGGADISAESKARGWAVDRVETATWWIRG